MKSDANRRMVVAESIVNDGHHIMHSELDSMAHAQLCCNSFAAVCFTHILQSTILQGRPLFILSKLIMCLLVFNKHSTSGKML
jgi:hypothetical protein